MFFTEETYRAVIVAAIQDSGRLETVGQAIEKVVRALQEADRQLSGEQEPTSAAQ